MTRLFSDASQEKPTAALFAEVWAAINQIRTARTAEATSIADGDFTVKNGGSITVEGGKIAATYPSGRAAALFGPLTFAATGLPAGHGLLVQADDDADGRDIFQAVYYNGRRLFFIGQTPGDDSSGAADLFLADSVRIGLHTHGDELRLQTHGGGDLLQYVNGDLRMIVDAVWDANITGNLDFDAQGTALIQSNTTMQLLCDGTAALGGSTGTFLQPASGGVSANVHMDTATGRIRYVSSSARYKTDIQDLEVDTGAVMQLRPRSWLPAPSLQQCPDWMHSLHEQPEDCRAGQPGEPATGPRHVGFIAEELDDIGLGEFVSRDAEGLPDGIHYDRLTAALIPLVQQQQAQIDALSSRLDALESTEV